MERLVYTAKLVRENWRKNYRHHGGVHAVGRCGLGVWRLLRTKALPEGAAGDGVDCVTFSVVPNLTALWAKLMARAIPGQKARIWIGDCSGGFSNSHRFGGPMQVTPILNYLQGLKLDWFFERFIRSEFFVVSDDDVFWLNEKPWLWAMDQFSRNPSTAVVSLVPRLRFEWELSGRKYQPMGSYCLVVRRDVWLKEGLSFQAVPKPSPSTGSYAGLYDTCDFANVALLQRGYRIAIAPPEVRDDLAVFKGISSAILRIQKEPPEGYAKAYAKGPKQIVETCLVAKQLRTIIARLASDRHVPDLARPELIERAERELASLLDPATASEVQGGVKLVTGRIAESLRLREPILASAS